ncbi:MAG TPA: alpha/beta fold hydrolase [Streptosporangiaceae bacterium]
MTTFVLIPGAGGMASYWQRLVPLLREAGHDAIAVDLPGDDPNAGLPEYAALVRAAVDRASLDRTAVDRATVDRASLDRAGEDGTATDGHGDVTLVAQSLGGFTAPLAAAPPVSAIVFVNAMIPVPGETPGAWWDATGQSKARIAAAERHGYGTGFDLPAYFLHDVPESVLASAEEQRDESDAVFASVCDFTAWPAIPVKVVAGAGDRFFPLEFQQRVARERLDLDTDVLPGGHLIALSRPGPLARYLVEVSGLRRYGSR